MYSTKRPSRLSPTNQEHSKEPLRNAMALFLLPSTFCQQLLHARMRICLRKGMEGSAILWAKGAAKQRKASKMRFMTIECSRSVHSIVLRMARVNCIVLECIRQVITQVPLGGDPVGFLDTGVPQEGRIMAVGADHDGNGSFGNFFPEVSVRIRPAVVVS